MKKIIYLIAWMVWSTLSVSAQTQSENYIKTTVYKVATSSVPNPTDFQKIQNITYLDGLGRPIQQVAYKQSNTGKDIVTPIVYDAFGKQTKNYLPYVPTTAASLDIKTNAEAEVATFYNTAVYDYTQNPYSEIRFDDSPLNRILEQAAPGNDWSLNNSDKHTIQFDYQMNELNEVVLYSATASWDNTHGIYNTVLNNSTSTLFYDPNLLYKNLTKNENWIATDGRNNTTETFTNKEGKVVLKRTFNNCDPHDTYYIYDQFGNLTYTLPPLVDTSITITQTILDELGYQYKYDYRNRLVEKKLPGKQWEFIVYDKLNRIVATGPTSSPFTSETVVGWSLTKYDGYNRTVLTAWLPSTTVNATGRKNLQDLYSATVLYVNETKTATNTTINAVNFRYTNNAIPSQYSTLYHILTVNYFDDYNSNLVFNPTIPFNASDVYYNNSTQKPKGLPTMSWVRVLTSRTVTTAEQNYTLYDYKGRGIITFKKNHTNGFTQIENKLDFVGKVLNTITTHKANTSSSLLTVRDDFTYTNQDRLLAHTQTINNAPTPELQSENSYTELGQLIEKKVGRSTNNPLQLVNYSYNIRGWLTGINDTDDLTNNGNTTVDLFAFKINYNKPDVAQALYNGNISETYWRSMIGNIKRSYNYQYDHLNRLTDANYSRPASASNPDPTPIIGTYDEHLAYDKNGNIRTLRRNGGTENQIMATQIDDLEYSYSGNQLMTVADNTTDIHGFNDGATNAAEYGYDANGNMIRDDNKAISRINYNDMNLPTQISFTNGGLIRYIYNALGQKISKTVQSGGTTSLTEYYNGFQYNNGVLQFFPTTEGYVKNTVVNNTNTFDYVYNYTDHLGNIRVSYGIDPATQVMTIYEENNYYTFGLKHAGYDNTLKSIVNLKDLIYIDNANDIIPVDTKAARQQAVNPGEINNTLAQNNGYQYKYQGQERQDELGLNWDSFKWRNYDYTIGRFMSIDPLAEKYTYNSPYAFQENKMGMGRELEGLELVPFSSFAYAISTLSPANKEVLDGVKCITFGTLGAIGAGYYCGQTAGVGAALGGGVAFTLSIAEVSLGIAKIGNALNGRKNYAVSESNSLPGWMAHTNNTPYAKAIDGVGSFLPGLLTGTWLKDLGAFRSGTVKGALESYDAAEDLNDFGDAMEDFYEGDDTYIDDPNDFFQERPELESINLEPAGIAISPLPEIHSGDFTITSVTNPFPEFDNSFPDEGFKW